MANKNKFVGALVVIIVAGMAIGVVSYPAFIQFVFPVSAVLIFALTALENHKTVSLFVGAIGFILLTTIGALPRATGVALIFKLGAMLVIWWALRRIYNGITVLRETHYSALSELNHKVSELNKDKGFYLNQKKEFESRIVQRRNLMTATREMGGLLNAREIISKLSELAQTAFPGSKVRFSPGVSSDPLDAWVIERYQPVLVEDFDKDPRFSVNGQQEPIKSALAVPVITQGQTIGVIRADSPGPVVFVQEDLRFLDLLSGIASLALDNTALFARVEELAIRDGLTNLFTHRIFQERLAEELLRAGRYKYTVSVIMMDLDNFKLVNDTYGHQAGDTVLLKVARIIKTYIRPVDIPSRYGGEEFAIIMPDFNHNEAVKVSESIRYNLANEKIVTDSRSFGVSASLGVASFPQEATTPQQLLRVADERMYGAKRSGKNRVVGG